MFTCTLPFSPVAKGRPRTNFLTGNVYTPAKTKAHEKMLKEHLALVFKREPFEGALHVDLMFTIERPKSVKRAYPSVKPDLDNYAKAFLDAANGVLYKDDAAVVSMRVAKRYGERGEIYIKIEKIDQPPRIA